MSSGTLHCGNQDPESNIICQLCALEHCEGAQADNILLHTIYVLLLCLIGVGVGASLIRHEAEIKDDNELIEVVSVTSIWLDNTVRCCHDQILCNKKNCAGAVDFGLILESDSIGQGEFVLSNGWIVLMELFSQRLFDCKFRRRSFRHVLFDLIITDEQSDRAHASTMRFVSYPKPVGTRTVTYGTYLLRLPVTS